MLKSPIKRDGSLNARSPKLLRKSCILARLSESGVKPVVGDTAPGAARKRLGNALSAVPSLLSALKFGLLFAKSSHGMIVEIMGERSIRLALIACLVLLAGLVLGQVPAEGTHAVNHGSVQSVSAVAKADNELAHCPPTASHPQQHHQHQDEDGAPHGASCSAPASAGIPAAPPGLPITLTSERSVPMSVTSLRELGIAPPHRPPRLFS
jgi:hypothetical protein